MSCDSLLNCGMLGLCTSPHRILEKEENYKEDVNEEDNEDLGKA
jgi:hypothetical protein